MKAQPRSGRDHSSANGAGNSDRSHASRRRFRAQAIRTIRSRPTAAPGLTEYIRAFATYCMMFREAHRGSEARWPIPSRFDFSSMAWPKRDIGQRQAAVPEQVGFGIALPSRLQAGHDLPEFRMQGLFRELAGLDMRTQAAELAALALAPIIDHELCHDVGQRQLDGAHGAVGHHERTRLDPGGLQKRRRLRTAARLRPRYRRLRRNSSSPRSPPPSCRDRWLKRSAKALRLSSRREWTRISSKSNR